VKNILVNKFTKSQISAFVATAVDFILLIILVELFNIWYVFATALGALAGAIGNFLLGRHWCFDASDGAWRKQAMRYSFVAIASLFLNTYGVFLLTDGLEIQYVLSKILIALSVGVIFNYPMHRFYVFETKTP